MITQEEIDYIIEQKTPFLIKNKKGKWIFPFKSIEAQKQVIEHLKKGVYEKISKLSQHDVSGCVCDEEDKHGWTEVKCCNECGLSVEDFWNKHIH